MRSPNALALGLCLALSSSAFGSIVNPDAVTLTALAERSSLVITATVSVDLASSQFRLCPSAIVAGRAELLPPPLLLAPATGFAVGQRGMLFLKRDVKGALVPVDPEHGWIVGDSEALDFVQRLAAARAAGRETELQLKALESRSRRVREDALRELGKRPDELSKLNIRDRASLIAGLRRALSGDARDAVVRVLAALPARAAVPVLIEAARAGVDAEELGAAIAAKSGGLAAAIGAFEGAPKAFAPVLGHSASAEAVPPLIEALSRPESHSCALRALAQLARPEGVAALKAELLKPSDLESAAWAATGLAFSGGDEALGALEFARWNSKFPKLRGFIARLTRDPAQARQSLRSDSLGESSVPVLGLRSPKRGGVK